MCCWEANLPIFAGFVSSPLKLKGSSSPWWRSWSEAKIRGSDPDVSSLDWKGRGFTRMETFRASSHYVASCLDSNLCISTFTLGSLHPQSDGYRTFHGTEEMTNDQRSLQLPLMKVVSAMLATILAMKADIGQGVTALSSRLSWVGLENSAGCQSPVS